MMLLLAGLMNAAVGSLATGVVAFIDEICGAISRI